MMKIVCLKLFSLMLFPICALKFSVGDRDSTQKLAFDIGMNRGDDTAEYLRQGYQVVAIEANPSYIRRNTKLFAQEIKSGRLTIVHHAISDIPGNNLTFYVPTYNKGVMQAFDRFIPKMKSKAGDHKELTFSGSMGHADELASMSEKNACWLSGCYQKGPLVCKCEKHEVQTTTTSELIKQYGVPHYLKVDIEGFDGLAMNDLAKLPCKYLPPYISFEEQDGGHPQKTSSTASIVAGLSARGYTWKVSRQLFQDHSFIGTGPFGEEVDDYTVGKLWRSGDEITEQANAKCWARGPLDTQMLDAPKYMCDVHGKHNPETCKD